MKQIGTAYRVWENDNGDKYPQQQVQSLGGCEEEFAGADTIVEHIGCLPYSLMQNEMGQSPKVVMCPSDDWNPNTNFFYSSAFQTAYLTLPTAWPSPTAYGSFDNTNVSYFVGVGANDTTPQSLLGGDRNLGNGGTIADRNRKRDQSDAGCQLRSFRRRNTSQATTQSGADACYEYQWGMGHRSGAVSACSPATSVGGGTQAVAWSAKLHWAGNLAGAGNIMLGDGSAQQCTSAGLRQTWLKNAEDSGFFDSLGGTTAKGDIHVVFP